MGSMYPWHRRPCYFEKWFVACSTNPFIQIFVHTCELGERCAHVHKRHENPREARGADGEGQRASGPEAQRGDPARATHQLGATATGAVVAGSAPGGGVSSGGGPGAGARPPPGTELGAAATGTGVGVAGGDVVELQGPAADAGVRAEAQPPMLMQESVGRGASAGVEEVVGVCVRVPIGQRAWPACGCVVGALPVGVVGASVASRLSPMHFPSLDYHLPPSPLAISTNLAHCTSTNRRAPYRSLQT